MCQRKIIASKKENFGHLKWEKAKNVGESKKMWLHEGVCSPSVFFFKKKLNQTHDN
jgi:hypothetical protein